jgi:hypothetical protein
MNASFLSRQVYTRLQAPLAATFLATLAACTNIKDDGQPGGTAGAPVGATPGASIAATPSPAAQKKDGPAGQQSALDAQLAGLDRQIEGRKQYNAKLREFISAKEQLLESVLKSDRSAGPTVGEFDLRTSITTKVGEVDRAARSWQETIDAHKAVIKGASTDPRGPELEAEVNRLAAERTELLRLRAQLVSITGKLAK